MHKKAPALRMISYLIVITTLLNSPILLGNNKNEIRDTLIKHEIEQVVITGTRSPQRVSKSPVLTTIITEQEIRLSQPLSTIDILENAIPGLISMPNAMGNNIRIRGLNSRYTLILIDGQRVAPEGAGGNINLDQIDINSIQKIEIINGAASALYGSNAVGSVINIITKKPNQGKNIALYSLYGANKTIKASFSGGITSNQLSLLVGYNRSQSNGFGGESDGVYAAKYEDNGGQIKLCYKIGSSLELNNNLWLSSHEVFNPKESFNIIHKYKTNILNSTSIIYNSSITPYSLRADISYSKNTDYDINQRDNNSKKRRSYGDLISASLVNSYNPTNGLYELIIGADINHHQNFSDFSLGDRDTHKSIYDIALFAQTIVKSIKRLDLILGTRYTHNSAFSNNFSPKISAMYRVADFKIRSGVGFSYRAPDIKELYYDFDHQGMFFVKGNPNLIPEKGVMSTISTEYSNKKINASITLYNNKIDNKITQYDVIDSNGINYKYYKNISSANISGADIEFNLNILENIYFKGTYSYCYGKDNSTSKELESNIRHSASFGPTWSTKIYSQPIDLMITGRFHSPKKYLMDNNWIKSKNFKIVKLTLNSPIEFNSHKIDLSLKIDNLFNFKESSFIDPGRALYFAIRYNFNKI